LARLSPFFFVSNFVDGRKINAEREEKISVYVVFSLRCKNTQLGVLGLDRFLGPQTEHALQHIFRLRLSSEEPGVRRGIFNAQQMIINLETRETFNRAALRGISRKRLLNER
jgi:hypothetical protein